MMGMATDILRLTVWRAWLAAIFVPLERLFAIHRQLIWRRDTGMDQRAMSSGGGTPSAASVALASGVSYGTAGLLSWNAHIVGVISVVAFHTAPR